MVNCRLHTTAADGPLKIRGRQAETWTIPML